MARLIRRVRFGEIEKDYYPSGLPYRAEGKMQNLPRIGPLRRRDWNFVSGMSTLILRGAQLMSVNWNKWDLYRTLLVLTIIHRADGGQPIRCQLVLIRSC